MEEPGLEGPIPFLDTKVTPGPNNTLVTTVYRKPTHPDQYLHWDSNHFIGTKHSVYNTLAHRAMVVSHNHITLEQELQHIRDALQCCHFHPWALNQLQHKFKNRHNFNNGPILADTQPNNNNQDTNSTKIHTNHTIVVPYIHGIGEKFRKVC